MSLCSRSGTRDPQAMRQWSGLLSPWVLNSRTESETAMQPTRFEERQASRLLGIQRRLDPQATDWEALWREEYAPRLPEIRSCTTGKTCLGAYIAGGSDGLLEFVAGRPAREGIEAPPGLIVRELPAATYAVFECTMADIGATWHAIYGDWLPSSNYLADASKACIEEFAPGCHEGTVPVRIFVPVMRRTQAQ